MNDDNVPGELVGSEAYLAQAVHDAKREDVPQNPSAKVHSSLRRVFPKLGRNVICPCGSGLKAKRCCLLTHGGMVNALSNPRA